MTQPANTHRVDVDHRGRGCYVVTLDGLEYTRFGTFQDAHRFARELRVVLSRKTAAADKGSSS